MAQSNFSYLDFLKSVLAKPGNIPEAMTLVSAGVGDVEKGIGEFAQAAKLLGLTLPEAPVAAPTALSVNVDVADAERQVLALCKQHGPHAEALGDGKLLAALRGMYQLTQQFGSFVGQNPQLVSILLGLLKVAA